MPRALHSSAVAPSTQVPTAMRGCLPCGPQTQAVLPLTQTPDPRRGCLSHRPRTWQGCLPVVPADLPALTSFFGARF